MLIDEIRADLTTAMKAKDALRQRTLRSAIAAVQEAQVSGDAATTLDDDGVQAVLKSQVKRRVDAAEAFESGGAADRAAEERAEIEVLEAVSPEGADAPMNSKRSSPTCSQRTASRRRPTWAMR